MKTCYMPITKYGELNNWLHRNQIPVIEIHMRNPDFDPNTSSPDLKLKHLNSIQMRYKVLGAFDDRLDVCEMFKQNGIEAFHLPFQGFVLPKGVA